MDRKLLIKAGIYAVIAGLCIGLGSGAVTRSLNTKTRTSNSNERRVAGASISTKCPNDYILFENEQVSFCYPITLTLLTDKSDSTQFFFSSENELLVEFTTEKKIPLHLCNRSRDTLIDGFDAKRVTFRKETAAGCSDPIGYATTIYTTPIPLFMRLIANNDQVLPISTYIQIEQSIEFK